MIKASLIFLILFLCSLAGAQISYWPPNSCVLIAANSTERTNLIPSLTAGCLVVQTDNSTVYEFNGTTFVAIGGAGAGGITTLNSQTGAVQIFANDANFIITSSNNTHTLGWNSTLSLARGGSGASLTGAAGGFPYFSTTSAMATLIAGTSGQILTSGGAGAPTWTSASSMAITSLNSQTGSTQIFSNDTNVTITSSNNTHALGFTGTLSVARGGTGAALSPALGDIVYTDASKLVVLAAGTSGQFLQSSGAGAPTWSVPTDTGITSLNSQTGTTQIFSNDTNITITSSANTHALTWASTLALNRGGTNTSLTAANGGVVYSDAAKLQISAIGTSGQFLKSNGASAPTWSVPTDTGITSLNAQTGTTQVFANDTNVIVTSSNNTHTLGFTGTLSLTRGGTGASITSATGGIVYGASTSAMSMTVAGTSGQILTSGGAGAPTWTSVLPIANGGTNNGSLGPVVGGIVYTDASKEVVLAAGTSGQVLTSGGGAAPTWSAPAASGITSLNSQTGATQVFANDANITITSSNNTHTLGWASTLSVARGGTGHGAFTSGSILYSNGTIVTQDNSNLFWDGTNKRLGVGFNAPTKTLYVRDPNPVTFELEYSSSDFTDTVFVVTGTGTQIVQNFGDLSFQNNATSGGFTSGTDRMIIKATTGNVGIGTTGPNAQLDVSGFIEWLGQSRVSSTFSKTSSTTLGSITGLSATLVAGKTYYFELQLYTTSNVSGGIKVDLNGGTATATAIIGNALAVDSAVIGTQTRIAALNTGLCTITAVTAATCTINGTITVNGAGTFIPEFAQNVSNGTASTVAIGSTMILQQIN